MGITVETKELADAYFKILKAELERSNKNIINIKKYESKQFPNQEFILAFDLVLSTQKNKPENDALLEGPLMGHVA